jgi:hypothetical protein
MGSRGFKAAAGYLGSRGYQATAIIIIIIIIGIFPSQHDDGTGLSIAKTATVAE